MLPRLGVFRSKNMNIQHMVLVDGNVCRPVCVRHQIKHGYMIEPTDRVTCNGCLSKGWAQSGRFGRLPVKDTNGRLLNWEQVARMSERV